MSCRPTKPYLLDASRLPVADRIQLFDAIWDTLPEESLPPFKRRVGRGDSENAQPSTMRGGVKTVPWDQVKAEALYRLAAKSSDASS